MPGEPYRSGTSDDNGTIPQQIDRLVLTREFGQAFERLTPSSQERCLRDLSRLLKKPHRSMIRTSPIPSPEGCHELRVGYDDRVVIRFDGSTAVLITVFTFREVAAWNAAIRRRIRGKLP